MVPYCVQPEERSERPGTFFAFLFLTPLLCNSCASPGPPKPPSLRLPQLVKDLSAERIGDHVLLRWTTPSRTTDEMEIKERMTAEVCRETDAKPVASAISTKPPACVPAQRLPVAAGSSEVTDTLPAALQLDPAMLLTYRIQIFNSAGHSAGESITAAYAAAGQAPAKIASLQVTASEHGAILEWQGAASSGIGSTVSIDLNRVDLSAPPPPPPAAKTARPQAVPPAGKKKSAPAKVGSLDLPNEVHLRAVDAVAGRNSSRAGTVDSTAAMGQTYAYSARRVREVTIGNRKLEIGSESSAPATLAMKDTFPPTIPSGLATVSGMTPADGSYKAAPYVDLSWEPNGEADLAGYLVYRQLARPDGAPQGPLAKLTHSLITVSTYRDVAVTAGQGYIYSVAAVDTAGNESAPSAKAMEVVEPAQ